ncbi:hypothetical protein B0A58_09085 [Flavobacterium branchiophilum NBRC 15030 = ATCC 35035]|uniref:Uncharacterized protein n=1 Tax=Flavobacterium branchiophilum TaxID=55197 RepID=A0A543G1K6_9FLAO|nr:hypothetical protein B0A58_09085 [Flavobacterium branchiophilum NBRC 15030 = ATCC 35035]TQM39967.1 hypothetical protein BC670_0819 [Flavobacterium branchiophilum]GEM54580.1 hypothetical protein FB1_08010 [Flavobacterium branchiophilum NBRC 15030 = ATCC 35035]
MQTSRKHRTANSRFAKAGVSCFYESEVLISSFGNLMKFSAKNPRLRKALGRQSVKKPTQKEKEFGYLSEKNSIQPILKDSF